MKKKKKPMGDKVTVSQFFKVRTKIIRELYEVYKFETTFIILLSCVTICLSFIDLKFLEYMTNSISEYIASRSPINLPQSYDIGSSSMDYSNPMTRLYGICSPAM